MLEIFSRSTSSVFKRGFSCFFINPKLCSLFTSTDVFGCVLVGFDENFSRCEAAERIGVLTDCEVEMVVLRSMSDCESKDP